jgi:hypothetical protein
MPQHRQLRDSTEHNVWSPKLQKLNCGESLAEVSAENFLQARMDKEVITNLILSGGGRTVSHSQRVTWWMCLLDVLQSPEGSNPQSSPSTEIHWIKSLQKARLRYTQLMQTLPARPDTAAEDDDPLSVNSSGNSAWQKYFEDEKLCKSIVLDLERTHPDSEFFQLKSTQDAMLNILFIWARLHPDVSYRQGMNELLSPIFLIVFNGHTSGSNQEEKGVQDDAQLTFLDELVNPEFVEHDSFALFEAIMFRMKKFFVITNDVQVEKEKPDLASEDPLAKQEKVNALVATCDKIQKRLLKKIDPKLADHLANEGVEPQIYGLYLISNVCLGSYLLHQTMAAFVVHS